MSDDRLMEILRSRDNGESLFNSLTGIRKKAEPLLSRITVTFPDYTKHDIGHSEQILKYLNLILPDTLKENLGSFEIFFLIAAAYLHDIGMVDLSSLTCEEEEPEHEHMGHINHEEIRENHHLRSEEFIVRNFKELSIDNAHEADIIGRICRGHRIENLHDEGLFKRDRIYRNEPVNVPLLVAFLRIADELDLTFERAPPIIYEHTSVKEDSISQEEWEKHLSVSGVSLGPEDKTTIICSAKCENPKVHRALKRLETKINKELEDLPDHLHHYREHRRLLPRRFFLDIEAVGYKPYDFRFSLQEKEIVELLMGERLYKRKEESLRELLKNSVDGCRLRKALLGRSGLEYTPEVTFKLTPTGDKIVVTDNGAGMDDDIVERYFTKIGKSFYTSTEFLDKSLDFSPVSELGIGILSCFMIADRVLVETKMSDSEPLLIEIDDLSDYFFVRKGKRVHTGTSVTLFLKPSFWGNIELTDEIRHYARHLEFPIKVIDSKGDEHVIADVGYDPEPREYALPEDADSADFLSIDIDEDDVEGLVALLFEKDARIGLKPRTWLLGFVSHENLPKRNFVSHEGIFVANVSILPDYWKSSSPLIDLNLKGDSLDLNLSRNEVIKNDKFKELGKLVERAILRNLEDYFRTIEREYSLAKQDLMDVFDAFWSEHVQSWYRLGPGWAGFSEELQNLYREFLHLRCFSNGKIQIVRFNEIAASENQLYFLDGLGGFNEDQILQIMSSSPQTRKDTIYILLGYSSAFFEEALGKSIDSKRFITFLDTEVFDDLEGIIPKVWELVRFKNFGTHRFIELIYGQTTFLNRDNRFVDLLIKGLSRIVGSRRMAAQGFFRALRSEVRSDFEKVLRKQKEILKWFVEDDLIKENELDKYLLTKDDFP